MKKAVFLDKDGTLIPDIPYNVNPDVITLTENAAQALKRLQENGFLLIVISNQSGVARGYFTEEALQLVSDKISDLLSVYKVEIDGFYYCPHHTGGTVPEYSFDCDCRKPKPGLLLQAIEDFSIDAAQSWMIGDFPSDVQAGKAAGCKTILLHNGKAENKDETVPPDFVVGNLSEAADTILQKV